MTIKIGIVGFLIGSSITSAMVFPKTQVPAIGIAVATSMILIFWIFKLAWEGGNNEP